MCFLNIYSKTNKHHATVYILGRLLTILMLPILISACGSSRNDNVESFDDDNGSLSLPLEQMENPHASVIEGTKNSEFNIVGMEVSPDRIEFNHSGSWYQVLTSGDFQVVCEGYISECIVEPGQYSVINHSTGKRDDLVKVLVQESPINKLEVDDFRISWVASNSWIEVQSSNNFETRCAGLITQCLVGPGTYTVIDHTNKVRSKKIVVGEMLPDAVVMLLGNPKWIRPQVFEKIQSTGWPTEVTTDLKINSSKEIIAAFDVLEGSNLQVTASGGISSVEIPPFSYAKMIAIYYGHNGDSDSSKNPKIDSPVWSETNLVNGYTALSAGYYYNQQKYGDAFTNAESVFQKLGFSLFTRMVKGSTDTYSTMWPTDAIRSADGSNPYLEHEDSVAGMGRRAEQYGLDFIAYYKNMGDQAAAESHPEWVCTNPDGTTTDIRFTMMDFSSGWKDVVLEQLLELTDRGITSVYFDHVHMPVWGCFGTKLQTDFVRDTGLEAPKQLANGSHWSLHPSWRQYMEYQNEVITEILEYWKNEVRKNNPDFQIIVATGFTSGLTSPIQRNVLPNSADIVKLEFDYGRSPGLAHSVFDKDQADDRNLHEPDEGLKIVLAHTVPRDYTQHERFHTWAYGFSNEEQLLGFILTALGLGGKPDVFVPEQYLTSTFDSDFYTPQFESQTSYKALMQILPTAFEAAKYMRYQTSTKTVGVFFDEIERLKLGTDYEAMWKKFIWPSVLGYESVLKLGYPVTAVNDLNLVRLSDQFEVIFLPYSKDKLSLSSRTVIDKFIEQGGQVYEYLNRSDWSNRHVVLTEQSAIISSLKVLLTDQSDIWVSGLENADTTVYPFFYNR